MARRKYNPFLGKFTQYFTKDSTQTDEGTETRKQDIDVYRFSLISQTPAGVLPDDADLREVAVLGDGLYIYDDRGMVGDPQWYAILGAGAGYTHPLTHPSTMITEDAPDRIWFKQSERDKLALIEDGANQYTLPIASGSVLGGIKVGDRLTIELDGTLNSNLQSDQNFTLAYKTKLEGIESNANDYTLPTASASVLGGIKVGDRLTIELDGTLNSNLQSDQNFTVTYKTKLDSINWGANYYTHPSTHPATIIVEDANNRFVTDVQIASWDAKLSSPLTNATHGSLSGGSLHAVVTTSTAGFMTAIDKIKLNGIDANANDYTHPVNHPATIITQTPSYRFVTDAQISSWTAKVDGPFNDTVHGNRSGGSLHSLATPVTAGFLSASDKAKLDTITGGVVPHTHDADTDIVEVSPDYLFFTQTERDKLAGIANNANNYVHPGTHPASMIVQTASYRFVTDAQISDWNSKLDSPFDDTTHGSRSGGNLHAVVTTTINGFMSATDKVKLNGIDTNANNYTHPATHPATMITESSPNYLWFTLAERNKLSGIEDSANNYTHPATHPATIIVEDITHRFVTDVQITGWNNKIDSPLTDVTHGDLSGGSLHALVTTLTAGFMSAADKIKLNGVATSANNYVHPSSPSHLATEIGEVSPDNLWFTQDERDKLSGIEDSANNYTHPATHPATMIVEDITHRFVTDTQITDWNNKIDDPLTDVTHGNLNGGSLHAVATAAVNGFMSADDKDKLDNIADEANNYTHPATHPATMIVEDADHRFATDTEKTYWNAKVDSPITETDHGDLPGGSLHDVATTTVNGFMSFADKDKLDGIEDNANNYTHPATHPATMIVDDSDHRFITDTQISKLASIEWSANNYTHPASHPATMIVEDVDHRFVTDVQIGYWDAKCETPLTDMDHGSLSGGILHSVATNVASGFMSAADKIRLDSLSESTAESYDIQEYECELTAAKGDVVKFSDVSSDKVITLTDNRDVDIAVGVLVEKLTDTTCRIQHFGNLPDDVLFVNCLSAKRAWLGTDGSLTSTPPTTGYLQIMGECTDDFKVFLNVRSDRIKRNPF